MKYKEIKIEWKKTKHIKLIFNEKSSILMEVDYRKNLIINSLEDDMIIFPLGRDKIGIKIGKDFLRKND